VPVLKSVPKNLVLMLFLVVIGIAGWFAWNSYASHPIYSDQHAHGAGEKHEHLHSHSDGVDHGHQHAVKIGDEPHSHPHRHDRHRHDDFELIDQEGLTEVGHSHGSDQTTRFWAKATVKDGTFRVEFSQSVGGELSPVAPTETKLNAKVFNGSKLEAAVIFEKSESSFEARQPDGFHGLPTHIIKIESLALGDQKLDVAIPLSL